MAVTVSLVEDDDQYRGHLTALIGGTEGFRCIGSYRTGETALKQLQVSRPDVMLLDLELPGRQGEDLISEIAVRWPKIAVVVLTIHDDAFRIIPSLESGAVGYLVKPVSPARLLEAIAEAHAGGSPMSSQIARLVVRRLHVEGRSRRKLERLTSRETEVLEHIAQGQSSKEIADALGISERTIGSHLRKIYDKLQVHSRAAAVAKFLRRGA